MPRNSPDPYKEGTIVLVREAWSPTSRSAVIVRPPDPASSMIVKLLATNTHRRIHTADVVATESAAGDWKL